MNINNTASNNQENNQQTIEQLRAESELKTKWLSLIAHDFKGLFSNIQLLLDAFTNKSIPQELFVSMLAELKQIAEKNAKTLANTFAWVNSQTNGFKPHIEDVVIHNLFLELKDELSEQLVLKELSIQFVGNKDLSLNTDKFLLQFILKQIVENAIKYSNKRGVIEVIAHSESNSVNITIKDQGVGMKESIINDIGTLNNSPYTGTMQEKGAGLSLVIVKDFVELLNGRMSMASVNNQGSTVTLSFHH